MKIEETINKASILCEALPYIQKFRKALMVIKFGGSSMEDPELVKSTMRDIVLMECIGFSPVVVHGGGKAISAELKKQDIPVEFINGLRNTCERTIKVVDTVLHEVNRGLVELANNAGGNTVSLSGKEIFTAKRTYAVDPVTGEKQSIGFVGEITDVDVDKIMDIVKAGKTPVITPLGVGEDGQVYNINADVAACKVAQAIRSRKLVFLSDVPGIMRDPSDESTVIQTICTTEVDGLIQEKVLSGGMLPKIKSSVEALEAGTSKVHMIDGRILHSLLLEIFTEKGVGTAILKD
jgi:acetylglutamate kinase